MLGDEGVRKVVDIWSPQFFNHLLLVFTLQFEENVEDIDDVCSVQLDVPIKDVMDGIMVMVCTVRFLYILVYFFRSINIIGIFHSSLILAPAKAFNQLKHLMVKSYQ